MFKNKILIAAVIIFLGFAFFIYDKTDLNLYKETSFTKSAKNNEKEEIVSKKNQTDSRSLIKKDSNKASSSEIQAPFFFSPKLVKDLTEKTVDEIIDYYKTNQLDINAPLSKEYPVDIFSMFILTDFDKAKELYESGVIDLSKHKTLTLQLLVTGDYDKTKYLLEIGCNPNGISKEFMPPFILSVSSGNIDTCRLLLEYGADPFKKFNKENALDLAVLAKNTQEKTISFLLEEAGFELSEKNVFDIVKSNKESVLETALKIQPDFINIKDNNNNLLDFAVNQKNTDVKIIKILIDNGLELNKTHEKAAQKRVDDLYKKTLDTKNLNSNYDNSAKEVLDFIKKELTNN